jgi:hypothetical protein
LSNTPLLLTPNNNHMEENKRKKREKKTKKKSFAIFSFLFTLVFFELKGEKGKAKTILFE